MTGIDCLMQSVTTVTSVTLRASLNTRITEDTVLTLLHLKEYRI